MVAISYDHLLFPCPTPWKSPWLQVEKKTRYHKESKAHYWKWGLQTILNQFLATGTCLALTTLFIPLLPWNLGQSTSLQGTFLLSSDSEEDVTTSMLRNWQALTHPRQMRLEEAVCSRETAASREAPREPIPHSPTHLLPPTNIP